jgi:hypothetical protein
MWSDDQTLMKAVSAIPLIASSIALPMRDFKVS